MKRLGVREVTRVLAARTPITLVVRKSNVPGFFEFREWGSSVWSVVDVDDVRAYQRKLETILQSALDLMACGVESRSALKQAGSDSGIPYGPQMGAFVEWSEHTLKVSK